VRRLFSTFAHGAPGLGLLLLRVVASVAVVFQTAVALRTGPPLGPTILYVLSAFVGLLLLIGLWTPIAGALLAIIEIWSAFSHPHDPWSYILLGTLGAALAMLGPGAWSVDARLFGWKRIDLRDRKN